MDEGKEGELIDRYNKKLELKENQKLVLDFFRGLR